MAVQKNKKTRSRRGMRRSHDALSASCVSTDPLTGSRHLRHHVSADGFYKGECIKAVAEEESE